MHSYPQRRSDTSLDRALDMASSVSVLSSSSHSQSPPDDHLQQGVQLAHQDFTPPHSAHSSHSPQSLDQAPIQPPPFILEPVEHSPSDSTPPVNNLFNVPTPSSAPPHQQSHYLPPLNPLRRGSQEHLPLSNSNANHPQNASGGPFAYSSQYSAPVFDWNGGFEPARRWSMCDPVPTNGSGSNHLLTPHHPQGSSSSATTTRPWTSGGGSHQYPPGGGQVVSSAPPSMSSTNGGGSSSSSYLGDIRSHHTSPLHSSRPSTTSSLSSYASSHVATPHSEAFFHPTSAVERKSSFYTLPTHSESTDTIVDGRNHFLSNNGHSAYGGNSGLDDSNPFFFARELQTLQSAQAPQQQPPPPLRRPSSSHLHPALQTALATTSANDNYQFYDYNTPPSTAGSGYFDSSIALPQPPRPGSGYTANRDASVVAGAGPSPYSLIVENPDPTTKASRPHLCTHCNETFRRIHDAKRHAYGALGIKNYACMGGCGMTFKRSEGRARHWQREEVAGVGAAITVSEFFGMNPAMVGTHVGSRDPSTVPNGSMMIWGGKGCEDRHGVMMSGTMEEDRRLRNKARRERIMMLGARAAAVAASRKQHDDRDSDERPVTGDSANSPPGPLSPNNSIGPIRNHRTSYAVSPY